MDFLFYVCGIMVIVSFFIMLGQDVQQDAGSGQRMLMSRMGYLYLGYCTAGCLSVLTGNAGGMQYLMNAVLVLYVSGVRDCVFYLSGIDDITKKDLSLWSKYSILLRYLACFVTVLLRSESGQMFRLVYGFVLVYCLYMAAVIFLYRRRAGGRVLAGLFLWAVLVMIAVFLSVAMGMPMWVPACAIGMLYIIVFSCRNPENRELNLVFCEVRDALSEGRIETWIQPICDLESGKFVSGECLCRLRKKDGSIMMPDAFIPCAEETGLIMQVETAMLHNMCRCLADDRMEKTDIQYLEVNLSVKKGEQGDLLSEYAGILSSYGVSSDKINLELTETGVMEKRLSVIGNMHAMCAMGFHFSLDDFGMGGSNFDHVMDMPFSVIKLDRGAIQKAVSDEKAGIVVCNVIHMAHDLGMHVVAEGVETEHDLAVCRDMGADYVQGYYFSKPLPVPDFLDFAMAHACSE